MNYITLNNGVKIPQIGLGVFRTPDGSAATPESESRSPSGSWSTGNS